MANTGQNGYYGKKMAPEHQARGRKDAYVDGNTARRLQALPQTEQERNLSVSQTARRNRERAQSMSKVFVLFLAAVSVAVLYTCVQFLKLKSQITGSIETIAGLEIEYSQMKADNDAYESQLNTSVDLEQVKKKAMEELGMKYPADNQIMTYEIEKGSYVRQYQDVPDAK